MTQTPPRSTSTLWARFRFSVVGSLLSSPPARGALKTAIRSLAEKTWSSSHHRTRRPVLGCHHRAVVLHWRGAEHDDPVAVLRRAVRKDCGKVSLASAVAQRLLLQYRDHPHWSYQLHYDNLAALVKADPALGPLRSYSTVRAVHAGSRLGAQAQAPGQADAPARSVPETRRQTREIRSYEAEYVGVAVASRFPPWIAQGAHARRPVAAADRAGHPR